MVKFYFSLFIFPIFLLAVRGIEGAGAGRSVTDGYIPGWLCLIPYGWMMR